MTSQTIDPPHPRSRPIVSGGVAWASAHDHVFGQDRATDNERRTLGVVGLTAAMMVVEIAGGLLYGSMALLADGLHMASHTVALGIAAFAYRYARKHSTDRSFCFGTGKINALAGYSSAVLLGIFALGMAVESIERFMHPVRIAVEHALVVAVLGLIINGASVVILGNHTHGGDERRAGHADPGGHPHDHDHHHHDHNYRSAYFHVLADALTSVLAIGALLAAWFAGLTWLDPVMGVVGALLVGRWSMSLMRQSARILLDQQAPEHVLEELRSAFESLNDTKVVDLHVWSIGPGKRAAVVGLTASSPGTLEDYRATLPRGAGVVHLTIEIAPLPPPSGHGSRPVRPSG